jgi:hypothetical protein
VCLTIATADIGPADVVVDPTDGFLVFHPRVSGADRPHLARAALAELGIEQPRHAARCVCGLDLYLVPRQRKHLPGAQAQNAAAYIGLIVMSLLARPGTGMLHELVEMAPRLH